MLEIFEITESHGKNPEHFELIIRSENKKTLENITEMLVTSATRCNVCEGEVTKSGDRYLCLNGCGHVDGNSINVK